MRRQAGVALMALALCGGVQAQTNEQLKQMLDQAMKTIDDLKGRVKALEDDKQKGTAAVAPAAAGATAAVPFCLSSSSALTRPFRSSMVFMA